MADIRIKDLATTASSAASDDFMALDGATNGTRKMSAANPSVTTLTTSGVIAPGGSVHGANGSAANPSFAFLSDQDTGLYRIGANNIGVAVGGVNVLDVASTGLTVTGALGASSLTSPASTNLTLGTGTSGAAITVASATGNVSISSTTASGSAVTGALQVAGGIGVAGASFFGGAVSNVGAITIDSTQSLTRALIIGLPAQSGGNLPYVSIKPVSTFADFALGIENTNSTSGQGLGLRIVAGSTASDFPLYVRDRTNATTLFSVGGTGAATFAGAVAIGNTTAASVAAPSTHKVSILIGGVQFYLLASNV